MADIDWEAVGTALIAQVERAVRVAAEDSHGAALRCAAFHGFYADGTQVAWPVVSVATAEWVADNVAEGGLNPADMPYFYDPDDPDRLEAAITAAAVADDGERFAEVVARFEDAVVAACAPATARIRAAGLVGGDFFVVAADEGEELVPRSVSAAVLRECFPRLVAADTERARIAGLPPAERAEEFLALTGRFDGPLTAEDGAAGLIGLGAEALPALIRRIAEARDPWWFAMIAAEIGVPDERVVAALTRRLGTVGLRESTLNWLASALGALGRLDAVEAAGASDEAVAAAASFPLRSMVRPRGPLDYGPLADLLQRRPDLHRPVAERLAPGTSYRELGPGDAPAAFAALASPWPVIRWHAMFVLSHARLTPAERAAFRSAHARLLMDDPSAEVREYAGRVAP
ncbi:hypothetical protein [Tsukamurella pseudospumae]|uniref:DUF4303 domain-containing protein n=1 Tax=Tsukamurella pseudospumae TaxID=239498 RepID=A0A138AJ17_9ACTN|nr:hypothetical protein [Tsukamurella pseudospumae]KXP10394.1 hypothetical protein AXK60_08075 [Tsukamurella pseudospumae]